MKAFILATIVLIGFAVTMRNIIAWNSDAAIAERNAYIAAHPVHAYSGCLSVGQCYTAR